MIVLSCVNVTLHYSTYSMTTKAMVKKNNVKYKLTTNLRPLGLDYSSYNHIKMKFHKFIDDILTS